MVHELIFGLERFSFPCALFPKTDVICLLGSADMLHGQVGDELVHGAESFVAGLFRVAELLRFDPLTDELLFNGLPHVTEEGTSTVMCSHVHVYGAVAM